MHFSTGQKQKANEQVKGLTADPVRKTFWVYTDQSLFELLVGNEDRDVWKVYLENGKFDVALRHAKVVHCFYIESLSDLRNRQLGSVIIYFLLKRIHSSQMETTTKRHSRILSAP